MVICRLRRRSGVTILPYSAAAILNDILQYVAAETGAMEAPVAHTAMKTMPGLGLRL